MVYEAVVDGVQSMEQVFVSTSLAQQLKKVPCGVAVYQGTYPTGNGKIRMSHQMYSHAKRPVQ